MTEISQLRWQWTIKFHIVGTNGIQKTRKWKNSSRVHKINPLILQKIKILILINFRNINIPISKKIILFEIKLLQKKWNVFNNSNNTISFLNKKFCSFYDYYNVYNLSISLYIEFSYEIINVKKIFSKQQEKDKNIRRS